MKNRHRDRVPTMEEWRASFRRIERVLDELCHHQVEISRGLASGFRWRDYDAYDRAMTAIAAILDHAVEVGDATPTACPCDEGRQRA